MKVPQSFPAYMEAFHLYLKDNTRKSFDLAYLQTNWEGFKEFMESQEKPKKTQKPSKTRALKSLETAMKKCDEVVNYQADADEKKAVAAEIVATQKSLNASMTGMASPKALGEKLITEGVLACTRGAQVPAHALHAATENENDGGDDGASVNPEVARRAEAAKQVAATIEKVLPPTVISVLRKRARPSDASSADGADGNNGNDDVASEMGEADVVVRARKKICLAMEKCTEALEKAPSAEKTRLTIQCGDEIVTKAPPAVLDYIRTVRQKGHVDDGGVEATGEVSGQPSDEASDVSAGVIASGGADDGDDGEMVASQD